MMKRLLQHRRNLFPRLSTTTTTTTTRSSHFLVTNQRRPLLCFINNSVPSEWRQQRSHLRRLAHNETVSSTVPRGSTPPPPSPSPTDDTAVFVNTGTTTTTTTPTTTTTTGRTGVTNEDDVADAEGELLKKFLRAPFRKKIGLDSTTLKQQPPGALFPWRHSSDLLPRFIYGTTEYDTQGLLLGGNLDTSNPKLDAMASAKFFLGVPWYTIVFFYDYWKADLADNMTWAFFHGTTGLLSNVYNLPFDKILQNTSINDLDIQFDSGVDDLLHTPNAKNANDDRSSSDTSSIPKEENVKDDDNDEVSSGILDVHNVMEDQLVQLFESARQFGKDTLQVRLEMKRSALPAKIVCLSVFPFLSRTKLATTTGFGRKYQRMLDCMANDQMSDAIAIVHEYMADFQQTGTTEHTVLCQVLIPCEEVFWVKDSSTGQLVQGHGDEKFRTVYHLVRFEQVVTSHLINNGQGLFPFRMEQGNWQITDIDDLLGGNLLL